MPKLCEDNLLIALLLLGFIVSLWMCYEFSLRESYRFNLHEPKKEEILICAYCKKQIAIKPIKSREEYFCSLSCYLKKRVRKPI